MVNYPEKRKKKSRAPNGIAQIIKNSFASSPRPQALRPSCATGRRDRYRVEASLNLTASQFALYPLHRAQALGGNMEFDKWIQLVRELAWPVVALVMSPFVILKLGTIARLYEEIKNGGFVEKVTNAAQSLEKLGGAIAKLEKLAPEMKSISDTVKELKEETKDTRGSLDVLVIKEENKVSKEESKDLPADSPDTVNLTTDQMFKQIREKWDSIVEEIYRRAKGVGVTTRLIGYKGVNETLDELVEKGGMTAAAGALVKQVSNRWQPMARTQPRMSEWLTPQVYANFMSSAEQARTALGLGTVSDGMRAR